MGGWYLGALRAAEEMHRHAGEVEFADECRALFERGKRWMDKDCSTVNTTSMSSKRLPPMPGKKLRFVIEKS